MNYLTICYLNKKLKQRLIKIIDNVGNFFEKYLAIQQIEKYRLLLNSAFYDNAEYMKVNTLVGLKFICAISLSVFIFLSVRNFYFSIIGAVLSGAAGFMVPDLILKKMAFMKSTEFNSDLPYIIDLLYISTMSGQNIYNSLKILVEKHRGRICMELSRFLKEIDSGISRQDAYKNIISGSSTEDFRNLLALILQAEKYGSSINEILKQKSRYLRFEINQKNEMKSRKISIYLLFPLVFLILPAFVLLIGGPLIFSLSGSLLFY